MSEHEEFTTLPYINDKIYKTNINECNKTNEKNEENEEQQYLDLIQQVLETGFFEKGRNGNTQCIFGGSMRFSLKNGIIPFITTKKLAWKTCLKELLWFIRGETDNKILQDQEKEGCIPTRTCTGTIFDRIFPSFIFLTQYSLYNSNGTLYLAVEYQNFSQV